MSTTPRVTGRVFGGQSAFSRDFGVLYGRLWSHGVVDECVKETARLRNARITDCGF